LQMTLTGHLLLLALLAFQLGQINKVLRLKGITRGA
jgi:hypothetical protein